MSFSKELQHSDDSGFYFAKEMLAGDHTAAVNFDRLMFSPETGFIIMEFLLCEEWQSTSRGVTPYNSHPNRYWNRNKRKFLSLWKATLNLKGTLYLVNYARKGTKFEEQVLLIKVLGMNKDGITLEERRRFTRKEFSNWFREENKKCLVDPNHILDRDLT